MDTDDVVPGVPDVKVSAPPVETEATVLPTWSLISAATSAAARAVGSNVVEFAEL